MISRVTRMMLLLAALLTAALAAAQVAETLTPELVDQRISTLRDGGVGEDDERLVLYAETRTLLEQAASQEQRAARFIEALTSAPEQEAEIQARLDEIDSLYDPSTEIQGFTDEEAAARLGLARTSLNEASETLAALDRRLAARETSISGARDRIVEIEQRLNELPDELPGVSPEAAPSATEAAQWRDRAEILAITAERRAEEARQTSSPVRYSLLSTERAETAVEIERLTALVRELELRLEGTEEPSLEPLAFKISPADSAYAIAGEIADRDAAVRAETVDMRRALTEVRRQNEQISERTLALDERFATARRIVDFGGESDALGRALLSYWEEIGSFELADPTNQLSRDAGSAVIRRIEHERELASLASASSFVNTLVRAADLEPEAIGARQRGELMGLARSYRDSLRTIMASESEFIQALDALDDRYLSLQSKIAEYRSYLQGLVIWIPNHPPLWELSIDSFGTEIVAMRAGIGELEPTFSFALPLLLALALLLARFRGRLVAFQEAMNVPVARPRDDNVRYTLRSLGAAALRALPLPLWLLAAASVFAGGDNSLNLGLVRLLETGAWLVFAIELLRVLVEPNGLGRRHFQWPAQTSDRLTLELRFVLYRWLPLLLLAAAALHFSPNFGEESIGRIFMLTAQLVLLWHLGRTLRENLREGTLSSMQSRLRLVLAAIFLSLVAMVVYGQVFTVVVVTTAVLNSLWVGVGLLLLHAVLLRWLRVTRRRLRLEELLAQRAQQQGAADESAAAIAEAAPDLGDVSQETQQLVTVGLIAAAVVAFFYIWSQVLPAIDAFTRVTLWTSTSIVDGETITNEITLATVVTVSILAALTLFAAKRLPAVVEILLRSRASVSPGARYTVSTLLNYTIIGTGIVVGLGALGVKWGQLQWLVAALGVGIGFGLQEIVANFISGLIILFERPIRVGDIITIGDKDGIVKKIRIRATTIRDWDGKELLVPNKEFITGRLLNWTLSDSQTRLVIPIGIAYGSDVQRALAILEEIVTAHPTVLADPPPSFFFLGFGDNSLTLNARCFLASTDDRMPTLSELHTQINDAFNAAGIVIAFPQRDIHFDADQPLRIAIEQHEATAARDANGEVVRKPTG